MNVAPASPVQESFLNSNAPLDGSEGAFITLYGGSAGAAKSYMGLMCMLKYVHDSRFRGVITRLNTVMLKGSGGLFDTAVEMYKAVDPNIRVNSKDMKIKFSSGAQVEFKHYEHEKNWMDWQGLQIGVTLVDEAAQYTESRIDYIMSRLRSATDVESHLLMTCNPDYDSFLRVWLEDGGYLDAEGYPLKSMAGVITYTGMVSGKRYFEKTREEWIAKYPKIKPKTFRFIPGTIYDNPHLMAAEPDYVTTLENLPRVERARLLHGNWYAKEESSGFFKREWCGEPISSYQLPKNRRKVRSWDFACTVPSEAYPDPDYTAGVYMSKDEEGILYIEHVVRCRERVAKVYELVHNMGQVDGNDVIITLPQDPGAAGKVAFNHLASQLNDRGLTVRKAKTEKTKLKRFEPFAAMAENGMVKLVKGDWNEEYLAELESFDGGRKNRDDMVDATSDASKHLCTGRHIPSFNITADFTKDNPFNIRKY